jgi:SM-20-related protein
VGGRKHLQAAAEREWARGHDGPFRGGTEGLRPEPEPEPGAPQPQPQRALTTETSPLSVVRRLFVRPPSSSSTRSLGDAGELEVLGQAALASLYTRGYCVVDGALEPAIAHCAGAEALVKEQHESGGFADAGLAGQDARVRDDRTVFLHPERGAVGSPLLVAATELMAAVHRDVATAVRLRYGASRPELQLATYSSSGARYARHRDGFPMGGGEEEEVSFKLTGQGPMWRRVTAILYLNGPWAEANGGSLRLYRPREFAKDEEEEEEEEENEEWEDVAPEGGRLVIFMAGAVEHEVLPTFAPRIALTAWFS